MKNGLYTWWDPGEVTETSQALSRFFKKSI